MTKKATDIKQIERLIDRYFDASTSEAEERELKSILASTPLCSEKINEAKAVLGYFAAGRNNANVSSRNQWMRAAAAIAAAIACGIALLNYRAGERIENQCVAYIGTTEITDSHEVIAMMRSDLDEIGEAARSVDNDVAAQLSTLFNSSLQ